MNLAYWADQAYESELNPTVRSPLASYRRSVLCDRLSNLARYPVTDARKGRRWVGSVLGSRGVPWSRGRPGTLRESQGIKGEERPPDQVPPRVVTPVGKLAWDV